MKNIKTNLAQKRIEKKLTQNQLAIKSHVSLRNIQDYEQFHKDINNAKVETVYRLAKALDCNIEDIINDIQ